MSKYNSANDICILFQASLRPSISVTTSGQQKEVLKSWEVLSTHSITGKSSNAYKLNNDAKPQLDQEKVKDIYVVSRFQYIKSHFIWFWQQVTLTVYTSC